MIDYVPHGELLQLWKEHRRFPEEVVLVLVAELAITLGKGVFCFPFVILQSSGLLFLSYHSRRNVCFIPSQIIFIILE